MSALDGTGVQFTELPPVGPRRLLEHPASFVYFFRDSHARVTEAAIDVILNTAPNVRVTEAAIVVILNRSVPGARAYDLPPRGSLRAPDYTFLLSTPPTLAGQDQLAVGASTAATELPPRAPARASDYSWIWTYPQTLIGQDSFPSGEQLSGNTPPGPRRASSLTDPGSNQTAIESLPPPVMGPGQRGDPTILPPPAPHRANDYTFTASFPLELIGKDAFAPGEQSYDLPPRAPARSRDYSFIYTLPGQFPPPAPPIPAGVQFTGLPPRAALRARHYTHIAQVPIALLAGPPPVPEEFWAVIILGP